MSTNTNEPDISREQLEVRNPEVTYDSTDLSARAVVMFLICLAIGGVLITTGLWGFYKYVASDRILRTPAAAPISVSRMEMKGIGGDPALRFPAPRLQPDPVADLNKFRVREEEILNSYGWVDENNNKVRIPIEAAMDVLSKTGLPVRK